MSGGLVELKVTGLSDLNQQLLDLGAELAVKALAQAARKAFLPVLAAAKARVPVDSGALRDSLKVTVKKPKEGDAVVVVGLYIGKTKGGNKDELPPQRRWHFIELGTSHSAAHPFLRPALDTNARAVLEGLKTELAKSIARAIKKKAKAGA